MGLVYGNVWTYRSVMYLLYRRQYRQKYETVAERIPPGSEVLDLCCGEGYLAQLLAEKEIRYMGLDTNRRFVEWGQRQGLDLRLADVRHTDLPEADYVCCLSSLYHFLPDPDALLARMYRAARKAVILSEPVENVSASRHRWLRKLAVTLTSVEGKRFSDRFDEPRFRGLVRTIPAKRTDIFRAGRECLAILSKDA